MPFRVRCSGVASVTAVVGLGCSDYEFGQIIFPTIVDTAILYPYEPGPDSSGRAPLIRMLWSGVTAEMIWLKVWDGTPIVKRGGDWVD